MTRWQDLDVEEGIRQLAELGMAFPFLALCFYCILSSAGSIDRG